jgi:hypothetical protein
LRRACWILALALLVAAAVTWTTGDYLWLRPIADRPITGQHCPAAPISVHPINYF